MLLLLTCSYICLQRIANVGVDSRISIDRSDRSAERSLLQNALRSERACEDRYTTLDVLNLNNDIQCEGVSLVQVVYRDLEVVNRLLGVIQCSKNAVDRYLVGLLCVYS